MQFQSAGGKEENEGLALIKHKHKDDLLKKCRTGWVTAAPKHSHLYAALAEL